MVNGHHHHHDANTTDYSNWYVEALIAIVYINP